ncbi:MAG: tRNA guanosine(34) transglycosylase Tgt [Planctomycetota bacterium]
MKTVSRTSGRFGFALEGTDGAARAARLATPHGTLDTPLFMPVGTHGSIKGLVPDEVRRTGTGWILANTYHLHLRPGEEVVRALGGLHAFMGWNGPILTDSGGYQMFSLERLTRIEERGARMKSVVDGADIDLTPERAVEIQLALGPDVLMALDHCPPVPTDRAGVEAATDRTHRWLARCVTRWEALGGRDSDHQLFGIVQGGAFPELRRASAEAVLAHDLFGIAIGGVSVGEDRPSMRIAVAAATAAIPADRPRYLMGVGTPLDCYEAVRAGIDLFDCVTPTRHGRNHQAFTSRGRINTRNAAWRVERGPLDPNCACVCCRQFSFGALRHLASSGEMLAAVLVTIHNLTFFQDLMARLRVAILEGRLEAERPYVEACQARVRVASS